MRHMREEITSKTYDIWAWFYDHTFGALVRNRQRRAVQQIRAKPGDLVLDLGVGTGMTLKHYQKDVTIIGVDLSAGMLAKAAKKRDELGMNERCHLVRGDAMLPPFAEGSFDYVLVTHVISVVSDPSKLLAWAEKLVKPGGRIIVLNHFQSTQPIVAWIERVLNPIFVWIGWRSDLALEELLRGSKLQVDYCFHMSWLDLWRIVVLKRPLEGEGAIREAKPAEPVELLPEGTLAIER